VEETLARLSAAGIRVLPFGELHTHWVCEREGFVALVKRTDAGFGAAGSAGILTEKGLAVLEWRNGRAYFVAKGLERPAAEDEVGRLRQFARDLQNALPATEPKG